MALIAKQGYQRILVQERPQRPSGKSAAIRHQWKARNQGDSGSDQGRGGKSRAFCGGACEQAYHFGKGKLAIFPVETSEATPKPQRFSNRLHCATCDIEYREPSPALFSFNHPVGACPACKGFGRVITIDYNLALPDRSKTLAEGAVKPWQTGQSAECQDDLMKFCRIRKAPVDVPFQDLPKKWQDWVINGDPDYGKDEQHKWPRAWYGIKGYFRWLESKSYKMHVRVLLSRYRSYVLCPDCHGKRFQPEALLYRVETGGRSNGADNSSNTMTLADFYLLPVRDALRSGGTIRGEIDAR